jgi:Monooxygenase af470-like
MTAVVPGRHAADVDGDFVVFLIGMRVNKPWQVRRWLQVYRAMAPMIRSLEERPENGLLGWERAFIGGPAIVQYWRSFDDLERFARDPGDRHLPAWKRYNREVRDTAAVGIWHETYRVRAGEYEAIYGNMPVFGLAAATGHAPIGRKGESAGQRIGARAGARAGAALR